MYSSSEIITLPGKETGGITVHPIVEISLMAGWGGGMAQIVPLALVVECNGEVLTMIMESINMSDEQSVV